jgi:hypothetical protein
MLPSAFLATPRHGTLNIHPSLLPAYRGAAPVQRALEVGCGRVRSVRGFRGSPMDLLFAPGWMHLAVICPPQPLHTSSLLAHCICILPLAPDHPVCAPPAPHPPHTQTKSLTHPSTDTTTLAPTHPPPQDGVPETGVSVAFTVLKCDAGPILAQQRVPLSGDEQVRVPSTPDQPLPALAY